MTVTKRLFPDHKSHLIYREFFRFCRRSGYHASAGGGADAATIGGKIHLVKRSDKGSYIPALCGKAPGKRGAGWSADLAGDNLIEEYKFQLCRRCLRLVEQMNDCGILANTKPLSTSPPITVGGNPYAEGLLFLTLSDDQTSGDNLRSLSIDDLRPGFRARWQPPLTPTTVPPGPNRIALLGDCLANRVYPPPWLIDDVGDKLSARLRENITAPTGGDAVQHELDPALKISRRHLQNYLTGARDQALAEIVAGFSVHLRKYVSDTDKLRLARYIYAARRQADKLRGPLDGILGRDRQHYWLDLPTTYRLNRERVTLAFQEAEAAVNDPETSMRAGVLAELPAAALDANEDLFFAFSEDAQAVIRERVYREKPTR